MSFTGHVTPVEAEATRMVLQITPLERTTLELLAAGTAGPQIAQSLGTSEADLEAHLSRLFSRLGVASPTDAVSEAHRRGLLRR
jgi:DNA-binding NarL/FixJ family response regulator